MNKNLEICLMSYEKYILVSSTKVDVFNRRKQRYNLVKDRKTVLTPPAQLCLSVSMSFDFTVYSPMICPVRALQMSYLSVDSEVVGLFIRKHLRHCLKTFLNEIFILHFLESVILTNGDRKSH